MAAGYACDGIDLLARLSLADLSSSRNNDVWGWTDPQTGSEYALVGMQGGLAFVDVSTPTAPVYLGELPTQTVSSVWRDVKVYDDHAFVVADGADNHGIQIFDLTRLRGVTSPQTWAADERYTGIGSAHNIVIDETAGLAAAVGSDCNGGLHLLDISDPLDPIFQGCFSQDGYTHDAQCVTYQGPDADYTGQQICVGAQGQIFSTDDHFVVANVTDPTNPTLIGRGFYPLNSSEGYAHQGWFTEDQRYFIANDEVDDDASSTTRTIVFDMADLDNPEFAFFYFGPLETTDHNLYVKGQYAYLSNYEGGLRIVDLSGIGDGTLVEVASFDTYPQGNGEGYSGQWSSYPFFESGIILANDRDNGLFILQPQDGVVGTAVEQPAIISPTAGLLSAPAPNPARDHATLTFTADAATHITAEVLDLRGRRVALLYEGPAAPSAAVTLMVDTKHLTAGLYLIRVTGERFTATRRLSVVR